MALELFTKNFMKFASDWYKAALGKELNKMGLRCEDLLNSSRPEVAEALELADPDVVKGRLRRLKRASDLSFKAKSLTDYAPDMKLDPFKSELWEDIQKIKARDEEYAIMDLYKK